MIDGFDFDETDYENRIVSSTYTQADQETETSLRPRKLDDYIGQEKAKENLRIYIEAAKRRGESLDHVLLYGPPGLGKTTLSNIIAAEMGVNIRITSGPAIERQGDLAALLTNLGEGDVLFIDEIHRLSKTVEEILYPAMEDYALDIIIGKGPVSYTHLAPKNGYITEKYGVPPQECLKNALMTVKSLPRNRITPETARSSPHILWKAQRMNTALKAALLR